MDHLVTTDYTLFRRMVGNRKLNNNHVNKIARAISDNNLLESFPVLVNSNYEVADGQHRLAAAQRLGVPVYYKFIEADINTVKIMNSNQSNWTITDYVESYISQDNPYYRELRDYAAENGLPISSAAILMASASKSRPTVVRTGEFTVDRPKRAADMAAWIRELSQYCDFRLRNNQVALRALIQLYDNKDFNFDNLIGKIRTHGLRVQARHKVDYMILQVEEIYNHRSSASRVTLYRSK